LNVGHWACSISSVDTASVNATEASFLRQLETVNEKADALNSYYVRTGQPDGFAQDLARYRQVTTSSLREAAARYLNHARRVALSIVPKGRVELALPGSNPVDPK
jgi:zinc protease